MNTPSPCDICENSQFNPMTEDDEIDSAWCDEKEGKWGDKNCPRFIHYKSFKHPRETASGPFCIMEEENGT